MATSTPRTPEQLRNAQPPVRDFHVNELAADKAGSVSPFGPEVELPLPLDRITYKHPSAEDRPHLAEGR